jgi:hypothetical protein
VSKVAVKVKHRKRVDLADDEALKSVSRNF